MDEAKRAREQAVRSLSYATYFATRDGRISCCGRRPGNAFWFSDGYGDYLRSFNWAMAAMPELAPSGKAICWAPAPWSSRSRTRGAASPTAPSTPPAPRCFACGSAPRRITAGTMLLDRPDLTGEGYVVQPLGGGDYAIRIRHDHSRRVRIDS